MIRAGLVVACFALATPVGAATFERCSRPDAKVADGAIVGAIDLARRAAAAVGDTPEFALWSGSFSARHAEEVRANLKAIHKELGGRELKAMCLGPQEVDCKDGTYAFVLYDRPRVIHLCPSFFEMPTMQDARSGQADMEDGTREGMMIHEMSHFPFVAATGDECYGRMTCANMAEGDPPRALVTADSYQYYAEDVTLVFWMSTGH